jgi:hypothetical protein
MGWLPDCPDFRGYTAMEEGSVRPMLAKVGVAKKVRAKLPAAPRT